MNEILELTWDTWLKCYWWTLITIAVVKSFIYPYGQVKFWKWIKGKPLLDVIRGFLITSLVVLLGVDIVPITEWVGLDIGKLGIVLTKLSNEPIKMCVITAFITQLLIYRWRSKRTPGASVYGITPPPSPPPPPDDDPDN